MVAIQLCSPQALRLVRLFSSSQVSFFSEHSLPFVYVQPSLESLLDKTYVGATEVLRDDSLPAALHGEKEMSILEHYVPATWPSQLPTTVFLQRSHSHASWGPNSVLVSRLAFYRFQPPDPASTSEHECNRQSAEKWSWASVIGL